MTRLSRQDNDLLRKQEWRLLFGSGGPTAAAAAAHSSSVNQHSDRPPLPATFAQDTFLVKSYFSEIEKYYLILVTNLKQCWFEKLELEDIRTRSMRIKSFSYEEDSQLEALLLSLSAIFTAGQHDILGTSTSSPRPRIEKRKGELSLFVGFNFGLSSVQWEFKLSPMLDAAGSQSHGSSDTELLDERLSMRFHKSKTQATEKRSRNFLEDSDNEGDDGTNQDDDDEEEEHDSHGDSGDDEEVDEDGCNIVTTTTKTPSQKKNRTNGKNKKVDGMSIMFDHLILPLISLTNTYRKQVKSLEAVIKSKENEVVEALEMLEQSGVNYHHRRKATDRYDKVRAENKLQEDIEQLMQPHLLGPKELFSEKKIPLLCSIVSRNAGHQEHPLLSLESRTTLLSSQHDGMSSQSSARGARRAGRTGDGTAGVGDHTLSMQSTPAATLQADSGGAGNATGSAAKTTKETAELERRRLLQEQLDKEKAEKERSRKKKKLF